VSNAVKATQWQNGGGRMTEPQMKQTTGGSLCVFDERGRLIGTIDRPVQRDPLGPGRAKVYLARPAERVTAPKVAA